MCCQLPAKTLSNGIDSLDAVKLVQNLNAELAPALTLGSTAIFDHPNIRELADFIHEELKARSSLLAALSAPCRDLVRAVL